MIEAAITFAAILLVAGLGWGGYLTKGFIHQGKVITRCEEKLDRIQKDVCAIKEKL